MAIRTVQLFVNPRPGWRAKRRIATLRRRFADHGVTVLATESGSGQLEIDSRADHICCAGGDGTLRYVIEALCRSGRDISISVFPNGTVNLVAMECGYPRDPAAFVDHVLSGRRRALHYIALVGDVPMSCCASVGPDAYAVATVSPRLKTLIGRAAYGVAVCRFLLDWPRPKIRVDSSEGLVACEAIYIAKGRYFAGRWSLTRDASALSPALEVITVERASRLIFLRLVWSLVMGWPLDKIAGINHFRCTELTIATNGSAPLQADGDIVGCLPLRIALRPVPIRFA